MHLSLYLHFPFCKQKCLYCDFVSAPGSAEVISAYCDVLAREIELEGKNFAHAQVDTVFFGGGTPSLLPAKDMEKVLLALQNSFSLMPDAEFTSEANPGTLRQDWLRLMSNYGMNRISFGVQAMQDELLKQIGRIHTAKEAEEAVLLARKHGLENINTDLMLGLPGQKAEDLLASIRAVSEMGVTHISAYSLILEENTPLYQRVQSGKILLPSEDEAADLADAGEELLEKLGYRRYEISNYAKDGYRCRHNLGYWHGHFYLGLGIAAHSLLPSENISSFSIRRANPLNLHDYIREGQCGRFSALRTTQPITKQEAMFERIMLALRTTDGLSQQEFMEAFHVDFFSEYRNEIASLTKDGLSYIEGNRLKLTKRGLDLQNAVVLRFMRDAQP